MNQERKASSSSQPLPKPGMTLLTECNNLREKVKSTEKVNALIFYSREIRAAFESIEAMVNKYNALYPTWEADEIKAWEYCVDKACEISKETKTKFLNAIFTSSPSRNTGGSKKVMIWKNQCVKNVEKIESLIKNTLVRDDSTWSVRFVLHGICHGAYGVLVILGKILALEEYVDAEILKVEAEGFFEKAEKLYKESILEKAEIMPGGMERWGGLLEQSNLKDSVEEEEEEEAFKEEEEDSLKEEEDLLKRFQEEIMEILQNNLQEEENQKISPEGEINKKKLHEALKNLHEEDTNNKLQEEETLNISEEEEAMKKLQVDETQKNSQETEVNKRLQEEEALKKSQEEKISDDEIIEFRFGGITVRMKNGVIERVLE